MRSTLLFLTAVLICAMSGRAQFPQTGAEWYYSYGQGINGDGYSHFFITGDSLLDGHLTTRILDQGQFRYQTGPSSYYVGPFTNLDTLFMYSSNDSVFIYREGTFHLAFKTAGQAGDVWDLGPFADTQGTGDDHAYLLVDSVRQEILDGNTYNVLYTDQCDAAGMPLSFNQNDSVDYYVNYSEIHEAYGPANGMNFLKNAYPTGPIIEFYPNYILCYTSDLVSQLKFTSGACTSNVLAGLEELASGAMSLYPNPASGELHVQLEEGILEEITVYDLSGRTMLSQICTAPQTTLQITGLAPGSYVLVCRSNLGVAVEHFTKE